MSRRIFFILQRRIMAEVEIDRGASLGAIAEIEPVPRESIYMSGEEEIMNKMMMEERHNEDELERAV